LSTTSFDTQLIDRQQTYFERENSGQALESFAQNPEDTSGNQRMSAEKADSATQFSTTRPGLILANSAKEYEPKNRLRQNNLVVPEVQQSISNFLGTDLGRNAQGRPTDEYYRIDNIPIKSQSAGSLGFVGVEEQTGKTGAYIDIANTNRWASALGVDSRSLGAAVAGQELVQTALMVHPQFKGKYAIQENEVIGEAYSFKAEGPAFLGRHLARMSVQDSKNGNSNYRDMPGITNPALGKVAAQYGIGEPGMKDSERAELFLSDFDDFMRTRLNAAFLGGQPAGEAVAVYAQERFGIKDGSAFSNDLTNALTDAYGRRATELLNRSKQNGKSAPPENPSNDEEFLISPMSFTSFES
jgi:hypothetical protein